VAEVLVAATSDPSSGSESENAARSSPETIERVGHGRGR
jgi:hypothetical protein